MKPSPLPPPFSVLVGHDSSATGDAFRVTAHASSVGRLRVVSGKS